MESSIGLTAHKGAIQQPDFVKAKGNGSPGGRK